MERPDLFKYDPGSGLQPEKTVQRMPNIHRIPGILGMRENDPAMQEAGHRLPLPKAGETIIAAALQPENGQDEYSVWHHIKKDKSGRVKSLAEQGYGKALLHEMDAEQTTPVPQNGVPANASQTVQPLPAVTRQAGILTWQNNVVASTSLHAQQPEATDADEPIAVLPNFSQAHTSSAVRPQPSHFGPGAVNPSLSMPLHAEPRLEAGQLTQDPEHMLEPPKKRGIIAVVFILKSPWFWLVVGVGLIIYFV